MRLHGVVTEFVGTGAIAFAPGLLSSPPQSSKKKRSKGSENKDTTTNRLESSMSTRRTINEWLPPFKANGYNPGEHQMPEPAGKGVADRTPTQDKVGAYDTELSGVGKEWPRDGNDTEAMDRVDDENISKSAEGAHESTHGEANDGHQKKIRDLNLTTSQKNTGSGVAEPFGGDRWSDGGTLPQGHGPGADTWTHTEGPGMPSDGPITGTDGPQLGHVGEGKEWNPNNMARLMGEDFDVQGLFNNYARTASAVCVEDFQDLLDAHGAGVVIDESSLLQFMNDNQEYMFLEGRDANGPYWVAESLAEGENRRPFAGKALNEDISSWDEPAPNMDAEEDIDPASAYRLEFGNDPEPNSTNGIPDDILAMNGVTPEGPAEVGGGLQDSLGGGLECPGCGYQGDDAECPECGVEMMDPMAELGGPEAGMSQNDVPLPPPPMESRRVIENSPGIIECLKNFMESARSLIERNPKAKLRDLAEALNCSWSYHAGSVNARTCPTKVQATLEGLMRKFPGFNPLVENEAMNKPDGTKLGGGDGPKDNLPKQPTEMTTHGEKSLLGKSQNGKAMAKSGDDGVGGDLWLSGTEKKLSGRSVSESAVAGAPGAVSAQPTAGTAPNAAPAARPAAAPQQAARRPAPRPVAPQAAGQTARPAQPQATGVATQQVQENIQKLGVYIKKQIQEASRGLDTGKYTTQFSLLVVEGSKPAFLKDKEKGSKAVPFGKAGKEKKDKAPPFGGKKSGKDEKPAFLKKNRTPKRDSLAEALADAEEILQLHNPGDVTFETTFFGPNGQVAMKQDIPLFTINARGPMVGEGKALFRFPRNAEAFAEQLVAEGVTCRVVPHNWGAAVEARTNYPVAQRAFELLAECGEGCATMKKKRQKQRV